MPATVQISTHVSTVTKERMEAYVRATGVRRAHLVEQALIHHLQALESLPEEVIVPARVVLTRQSAERVRELVNRPPQPSAALRRLFDDR